MDGKQIEDREALKRPSRRLDARARADGRCDFLPPLKMRGLCRLRKSTV